MLARAVITAAAEKKAENILLLDLRNLSSVADYFVVCSGSSERQLRAIAEAIEEHVQRIPRRCAPRRGAKRQRVDFARLSRRGGAHLPAEPTQLLQSRGPVGQGSRAIAHAVSQNSSFL